MPFAWRVVERAFAHLGRIPHQLYSYCNFMVKYWQVICLLWVLDQFMMSVNFHSEYLCLIHRNAYVSYVYNGHQVC